VTRSSGPPRLGARGGNAARGGAGRVIAGQARGIRLVGPAVGVRPLGDRLKQALFAILEPELRGEAFLDLFAGSGAAGIEALSRGAASATFVEIDGRSIEVLAGNLATTRLAGPAATVVRADALAWLSGPPSRGPFQVIVVDPPYDRPDLLAAALERVAASGRGTILATTGVLVAKHPARNDLAGRIGLLASSRERRFGESALTFYRWSDGEDG
jgi:16S rRNA (guanine966-N2)-methyltransferase